MSEELFSQDWETSCPEANDGQHCDHWYDGEPCCRCGAV